MRVSTLSNMNISGHWGGSLSVLNLGLDRIRTLVSMATDSSHRVIMGNSCDYSSVFIFDWFFFILAGNVDNHQISNGLVIRQDRTRD